MTNYTRARSTIKTAVAEVITSQTSNTTPGPKPRTAKDKKTASKPPAPKKTASKKPVPKN